jgi:hypothetical protein
MQSRSPASTWRIFLGLAAFTIAGCVSSPGTGSGEGSPRENRIQVSGTGTVTSTPDVATVNLGVKTLAKTADVAVAVNNRKAADLVSALKSLRLQPEDIQTTGFNVRAERQFHRDRPDTTTGYWATNSISVRVRDLSLVGEVLQKAVDAGANDVHGLSFSVEDPAPLLTEARRKAMTDARNRAATLAAAAGVEVGRVVNIRELQGGSPAMLEGRLMRQSAVASVPVQAGDLDMSARVEVVFEIR